MCVCVLVLCEPSVGKQLLLARVYPHGLAVTSRTLTPCRHVTASFSFSHKHSSC